MASKLVAFRLPQDLIEAIEAEAGATGKDKTSIVVNGLRQIFQIPPERACPRELPQQPVPKRVNLDQELDQEIVCVSMGSATVRS
jgi:hypothetical protein